MAADLLAAAKAYGAGENVRGELLAGAVGKGAGYEALSYIEHSDLQDPDEILDSPIEDLKLPERGDQRFALLGGVTAAALRNLTDERWIKAWDVMVEATKQEATDVAVVQARTLAQAFLDTEKNEGRVLPLPQTQLPTFIEILEVAGIYGSKKQGRG